MSAPLNFSFEGIEVTYKISMILQLQYGQSQFALFSTWPQLNQTLFSSLPTVQFSTDLSHQRQRNMVVREVQIALWFWDREIAQQAHGNSNGQSHPDYKFYQMKQVQLWYKCIPFY